MAKAKNPFDFLKRRLLKERAGIANNEPIDHEVDEDVERIASLEERLRVILAIEKNPCRPATNMIFFVIYDIASNKVRRSVAKYLEAKGCHRVQKSVFLADLPSKVYQEIENDLRTVQEMYDNDDCIFVLPLSAEHMKALTVIGHEINIDLILKSKSTMFF